MERDKELLTKGGIVDLFEVEELESRLKMGCWIVCADGSHAKIENMRPTSIRVMSIEAETDIEEV